MAQAPRDVPDADLVALVERLVEECKPRILEEADRFAEAQGLDPQAVRIAVADLVGRGNRRWSGVLYAQAEQAPLKLQRRRTIGSLLGKTHQGVHRRFTRPID